MKKVFLILCALLCSQSAFSKDMGDYGLKFLSKDFSAPVVFDRTAINAPEAGSIVYDSGSSGFFGLPPGADPSIGWIPLSVTTPSISFFKSSPVTSDSTAISSGSFINFSNSPGLIVAASVNGSYKVYCGFSVETGTNADAVVQINMTSGSGGSLVAGSQQQFGSSVAMITSGFVQSVYSLTAGQTYVFDIQGKALASNVEALGANNTFYMFAELLH